MNFAERVSIEFQLITGEMARIQGMLVPLLMKSVVIPSEAERLIELVAEEMGKIRAAAKAAGDAFYKESATPASAPQPKEPGEGTGLN